MQKAAMLVLAFLVSAPAAAQVRPHAGEGDPHFQVIDFAEGQIVELTGVPGYQLMIELSPDEQVQSVALGDTSAWQVSLSKDANHLFLKPASANVSTNMTVVTSVRIYAFDLSAGGGLAPDTPYAVQFRYPPPRAPENEPDYVDVSAASRRLSRYRITGDRILRPRSVSDDGQHTYVTWPRNSPIPAVYALDRSGKEVLLNGMMGTDDVYVVDGAPQKLIFRIDGNVARAERINPRRGR